ncbi:alcohol dehydrogenase [Capronia epimyces CBS 606.96]|uniref:Alcohol dehydrogenase n=1 Tax=Capronia epimyces CBS 606.96 TaxID=1182542 RepID=W9XKX6_9EURO|nr:alcohol dehydrogenase [Capronia epimyces CBS 606.96]EXJ77631.1 alcohol dehydrogenase [Capronia epimyces CBS 606.96]
MRVFVTGATGFVGTAVVNELLSAGHKVLGLSRSDKGVEQLKSQGAEALYGTIEDLEILNKGASECDAVIHLAFVHNFADFIGSCATDRAAITALGSALAAAGGGRALVITSGTMMLAPGKLGDEDDKVDTTNPMAAARGASETVCLDFAKQGVRASVVRLPPSTHGPGLSGFAGQLVAMAQQKGVSVYIGDGQNHWSAGHRDDAAKIYRLAVEKARPGSVFHAVAEEGVPLKDLAIEIGKQLDIPVVSLPPEKAEDHFGRLQFPLRADNLASSAKTRERLGWTPTGPTLIGDVPVIIDFLKSRAA